MKRYFVEVWLYCYCKYKDKRRSPWRKMQLLQRTSYLSEKEAFLGGYDICEIFRYLEEPGKRDVMFDIS